MAKSKLPTTSEANYRLPTTKAKLLSQGAEAKIFQNKDIILKQRIPKSYRHPTLDTKLRTRRTKSEAKILSKCAENKINVPKIIHQEKFDLTLQLLKGERLSETLSNKSLPEQLSIIKKLGTQIKKLHSCNIIHADLTTSNTILVQQRSGPTAKRSNRRSRSNSEAVYLVDFGLSYISTKLEDKAVDLHLLHQALQAKHYKTATQLFTSFLKTYKDPEVIARLKIVESRGRYKH